MYYAGKFGYLTVKFPNAQEGFKYPLKSWSYESNGQNTDVTSTRTNKTIAVLPTTIGGGTISGTGYNTEFELPPVNEFCEIELSIGGGITVVVNALITQTVESLSVDGAAEFTFSAIVSDDYRTTTTPVP